MKGWRAGGGSFSPRTFPPPHKLTLSDLRGRHGSKKPLSIAVSSQVRVDPESIKVRPLVVGRLVWHVIFSSGGNRIQVQALFLNYFFHGVTSVSAASHEGLRNLLPGTFYEHDHR